MRKEFTREQRLADVMQRELTVMIRDAMRDPRIGTLSVTHVKVSRDLAWADVYVSQLEATTDEARADVLAALEGAQGFLRSLLAKNIRVRFIPRLRFRYDDLLEHGARMDSLIADALARDRARAPADPDPNPEDN